MDICRQAMKTHEQDTVRLRKMWRGRVQLLVLVTGRYKKRGEPLPFLIADL
jgi:hypothetical protein